MQQHGRCEVASSLSFGVYNHLDVKNSGDLRYCCVSITSSSSYEPNLYALRLFSTPTWIVCLPHQHGPSVYHIVLHEA